jgi:hypothetical protein
LNKKSSQRSTLEKMVRGIDRFKQRLEPGVDKVLLTLGANAAAIYGASEIIDNSSFSDPTNALIMIGTGAALATSNYMAFKSDSRVMNYARKLANKLNDGIDNYRVLSWMKTGLLSAGIIISSSHLKPYATQVYDDFFKKERIVAVTPQASQSSPQDDTVISNSNEKTANTFQLSISSGTPNKESFQMPIEAQMDLRIGVNRPAIYDLLGYTASVSHDFSGIKLADKNSDIGRIQRTLRWKPIYETIEKIYGLTTNTLAGMIMEESYGDPVQPNAQNDGGLGIVHVQGTTGPDWGLDVHGNSNKDSDKGYGKTIKELIKQCNSDPASLQQFDERAHVIKVLDTAARIVKTGKNAYNNDNTSGIQFYRGPGSVGKNKTFVYSSRVAKWKSNIENPNKLKEAAEEFEKMNSCTFDKYLKNWHEMAENWGLSVYADAMTNMNNSLRNQLSPKDKTLREGKWVTYTVKPGDTLYHVTHRVAQNKISMDRLKKQNNIYTESIKPGMTLKLYHVR